MPAYKISVQFAGTNDDRLNDEVDGVKIFPQRSEVNIPGGKDPVGVGSYFHGVNPDNINNQVFSVGGPGKDALSERAEYEQDIFKRLEPIEKELFTAELSPERRRELEAHRKQLNNDLRDRVEKERHQGGKISALSDKGVNSTEITSDVMTVEVDKAIQGILANDPDAQIELDIQGASRGAVAATKFARNMNELYKTDNRVSANMMLSDPVPGGPHSGPFGPSSIGPFKHNKDHDLNYDPSKSEPHNPDLVKALKGQERRAPVSTADRFHGGTDHTRKKPAIKNKAAEERYSRGIMDKLGVAYSLDMGGSLDKNTFNPMNVKGADVVILENYKHTEGYKRGNVGVHVAGRPDNYGFMNQKNLKDIPKGVYLQQEEKVEVDGKTQKRHQIKQAESEGEISRFVKEAHCSKTRRKIAGEVATDGFEKHKSDMRYTKEAILAGQMQARTGDGRIVPEAPSDRMGRSKGDEKYKLTQLGERRRIEVKAVIARENEKFRQSVSRAAAPAAPPSRVERTPRPAAPPPRVAPAAPTR